MLRTPIPVPASSTVCGSHEFIQGGGQRLEGQQDLALIRPIAPGRSTNLIKLHEPVFKDGVNNLNLNKRQGNK